MKPVLYPIGLASLKEEEETPGIQAQREKATWRHSEKVASHLQAKERGLGRNQTCQHFDLDTQPPELRENIFLWFKPPSLWCFVMEVTFEVKSEGWIGVNHLNWSLREQCVQRLCLWKTHSMLRTWKKAHWLSPESKDKNGRYIESWGRLSKVKSCKVL